jgi:hypothetical protein
VPVTDHDWRNVPDGHWARSTFFLSHVWALFKGDRALMAVAAVGALLNAASAAIVFGLAEWLFGDVDMRVLSGAAMAAVALPSTVVSTYCNVALLRMAEARFEGRRCSAREGFRAANERLGAILAWSLLAVGVGVLLNWIAEKIPFAGPVASWLAGTAWSLGTMFAVPVLALEGVGARHAARRSVEIFRHRGGEGVAGTVSVAFVTIVVIVPGTVLLVLGFLIGGATGLVLVVASGAALLAARTVSTAMAELFALAVYRYEVHGAGSFGFEPGQLDGFVDLKRTGPRR